MIEQVGIGRHAISEIDHDFGKGVLHLGFGAPVAARFVAFKTGEYRRRDVELDGEFVMRHDRRDLIDLALDGKDTDLKTTKACPSAPRPAHVRQVALYRAARNKPGTVLYVTKAKTAEYDVTDAMRDEAMRDLEHAAQSLSRFLNKMDTPDEALACLPRNPDDFRTSAPSLRGTASGFEAMGA